jgi:hypothetical protein
VPDPIVADAQPAGSSPAVDASPAQVSVDSSDALSALSETELQTWRTTGDLPSAAPDASPVTAPPAGSPSATAVQDQPASTDATSKLASKPAWDPALLKAETKKRFDELLTHNARERERADRAEQQLARTHQPAPDARPAASSAAPAGDPALVKPDPETFAYGTADPAYLEALTDFKVATATAKSKAEWDDGQRQIRTREEAQRVITAFEAKAAEARVKHPDFDAVALLAPTEIQPGSAADLWVLEDDAGADILYHLQQPANAVERRRILALGPRQQLKELVRLGDRLTADPAAARSTTAPPPPPTLSSRATPGDAVERALADDDTGAYLREMNARDLALHRR